MKHMLQSQVLFLFLVFSGGLLSDEKGIHVLTLEASTHKGEKVSLYNESHALLISASRYTNGWSSLGFVEKELDDVERALKTRGFNVRRAENVTSDGFRESVQGFISDYGYSENNRLFFFFSGHGHSDENGKGYLVPVDSPLPTVDPRGFRRTAVQMSQIMAWARQMDAKHALFMFDSCFSGTIFKSRNIPTDTDRLIKKATARPVRYFISAGSAGETVPAKSTFTPAFVRAIEEGLGDLNQDGYVTGTELGLYLSQEVPLYVDQSPQFGGIRDYELSQGDFVFFLDGTDYYTQKSTVTTSEMQLVWDQLSKVSAAINAGKLDELTGISDIADEQLDYLKFLSSRYGQVRSEVTQLSDLPSLMEITGTILIFPGNLKALKAELTVVRNDSGWSRMRWSSIK